MNLPFFIARRYLFAKKSHNVINIISAISATGMAIGTAALIIILSIYNGFDNLVESSLGNIEPDILIAPAKGKVFIPEGKGFDWAYEQKCVKNICSVLQDNVFINYDGHQGVATAKGVDQVYEEESPLAGRMVEGKFSLHKGDVPKAAIGQGLAYKMGINTHFLSSIGLYYPDRSKNISPVNPAASVNFIDIYPSGIFSVNQDIDNTLIILPIAQMRELLGYEKEVSAVEIRMENGYGEKEFNSLVKGLKERLGEDFIVKDRFMQNETLYRMMRYEKAVIYLILMFIIIIIAFNIFGSLSMLIIEKRGDMETLRSFGTPEATIRRTFITEGWLISLLGLAAGVASGVIVSLAQQHFGFIKMRGNFIISSYPVILEWQDIMMTAMSVAAVGYLIALISVKANIKNEKR